MVNQTLASFNEGFLLSRSFIYKNEQNKCSTEPGVDEDYSTLQEPPAITLRPHQVLWSFFSQKIVGGNDVAYHIIIDSRYE